MATVYISSLAFHFGDNQKVIEYDRSRLHLENQQNRKGVDIVYICDSNVLYFIEVKDFTRITTLPKDKNLWFMHIDQKTMHTRDAIENADLREHPEFTDFTTQIQKNEQECCVAHAEINRGTHSYLFPNNYHSIILQSMKNRLTPVFPTMQFYAVDSEILSRLSLPWHVTLNP